MLRLLKLISLFLLFYCLQIPKIIAQNTQTNDIVINVENTSLSEVLKIIEKKSGVTFSYNANQINVNQYISFSGSGSLKEILIEILSPLNIQFDFMEKQVVLKKKKPETNKTSIINGYIKDEINGEAIIGATVSIDSLSIGVISNAFGFYSLSVPEGNHTLTYSFIGYESQQKVVSGNGNQSLSIDLIQKPSLLEEVIVTSNPSDQLQEIQLSKDKVDPKTITEMPALFGEMDVVKSLEFIPGIKSHSDGSTFLYIRGGQRDQNLLIIDDAPIFNASHLLGIFSTVIPDVVNSIEIYKGDMPASLGGRLSSVIDIRTKKGNDRKFQAWGNSGLISSKIGIEGPIRKEKSSYLISARASRIKWIFNNLILDLKKLKFYDLTAKLNFTFNNKNNLFFSVYKGEDNFFAENIGIEWSNQAACLRWNHVFGNKLFMNTTIAASSYDYYFHTDVRSNTKWKSHIANLNIKGDFIYFINPNNVLSFGIGFNGYNFNPGNLTSDDPEIRPPLVSIKNAFENNIYISHEAKLSDRLDIRYGFRLTSFNNQGDAFEFVYDDNYEPIDTLFYKQGENYNNYGNLEPRLSLNYQLTNSSSLKFSYTRNVQNVHLISNSISPFTSLEVWQPSGPNIKPQISDQAGFGYSKSLEKSGLVLSVETYYKFLQNQIDYEPHAETLLNPLIDGELRFGEGRSSGIEFQLKKEQGRLRGWIAYTASKATRTFDEINNGQEYNAFYDRPHEINLVTSYDLTLRLNIGLNWTYYTGSPYSEPIGFFKFNGLEAPIYGEKNNARLPDYHRLDVAFTYKLNKKPTNWWRHDLSFSLYNIYGRKNTLFVNYNKTETEDHNFRIPSNLFNAERVSTQYFLFRFTPSLTYNFQFN